MLRFSGISNFATIATPPRMLAFIAQPASTQAGQTMPPVTVAIQSTTGALVSLTGVPITLQFLNNPSGATLAGTLIQNTVNGVATFANLSINNVGTGFTLVASSPGYVVTTSTPFNITSNPLSIVTAALPDATQGAPYLADPGRAGRGRTVHLDLRADHLGQRAARVCPASGTGADDAGQRHRPPLRHSDHRPGAHLRVRVTDSAGGSAFQDLCIHVGESTAGTLAATPVGVDASSSS